MLSLEDFSGHFSSLGKQWLSQWGGWQEQNTKSLTSILECIFRHPHRSVTSSEAIDSASATMLHWLSNKEVNSVSGALGQESEYDNMRMLVVEVLFMKADLDL